MPVYIDACSMLVYALIIFGGILFGEFVIDHQITKLKHLPIFPAILYMYFCVIFPTCSACRRPECVSAHQRVLTLEWEKDNLHRYCVLLKHVN